MRRTWWLAALAGSYAAGIATMWCVFLTQSESSANNVAEQRPAPFVDSVGGDVPRPSNEYNPANRPHETDDAVVAVAEPSPYELLRQLGSESQRRSDLPTALAYYGQALDAATPEELKISYERDDWLLISLKKDRTVSSNQSENGDSI